MEWITRDDGEDEEDEVEAAFAPERQTCRSYPGKEEAEENRDENGGFVSVAKGGGEESHAEGCNIYPLFPSFTLFLFLLPIYWSLLLPPPRERKTRGQEK